MQKRLLVPSRVRRIPRRFSWVDHRLVRDRHIERCRSDALALYLLLLTVADARGLSYYADGSIGRLLSLSPQALGRARESLIRAGLIAWEAPLYQVLALDPPSGALSGALSGEYSEGLRGVGRARGAESVQGADQPRTGSPFRSLRELLRDSLGADDD